MNEVPRRARLDLCSPAELAIYEAMQAVEAMPADVRLTKAVTLLQEARNSVADYVDAQSVTIQLQGVNAEATAKV